MNWDDLSFLLAVMRGGSLGRAARIKGVDKSTVSRRLAALEAGLGVALTERAPDGRVRLTGAGLMAARRAEAMEDAARGVRADLGLQATGVQGRVRLTAVPLLVNHLLLPHVPALTSQVPGIALELIAEARDLNLLAGEADVALRLARPATGGQGVLARQIGTLDYGCFTARGRQGACPWIGYEPRMHYLSHAQEIARLAQSRGDAVAPLAVNDAETLLQAVLSGQGRTLLPRRVAARFSGLKEMPLPGEVLPSREIWLLVRRDVRRLARVQAVIDWIGAVLAA